MFGGTSAFSSKNVDVSFGAPISTIRGDRSGFQSTPNFSQNAVLKSNIPINAASRVTPYRFGSAKFLATCEFPVGSITFMKREPSSPAICVGLLNSLFTMQHASAKSVIDEIAANHTIVNGYAVADLLEPLSEDVNDTMLAKVIPADDTYKGLYFTPQQFLDDNNMIGSAVAYNNQENTSSQTTAVGGVVKMINYWRTDVPQGSEVGFVIRHTHVDPYCPGKLFIQAWDSNGSANGPSLSDLQCKDQNGKLAYGVYVPVGKFLRSIGVGTAGGMSLLGGETGDDDAITVLTAHKEQNATAEISLTRPSIKIH
jgi:hypothetical protein